MSASRKDVRLAPGGSVCGVVSPGMRCCVEVGANDDVRCVPFRWCAFVAALMRVGDPVRDAARELTRLD